MVGAKVLVVEDEGIIAKDIHHRLGRMGYEMLIPVSTGNAAIQTTEENSPDLILMDIVLKGDMDGIQTVSRIRERFDIPVIYLTANSDNRTVERAKITKPHGFLLKPFKDADAQISIEIALYKHRFDRKLQEKEEELATILRCVGDAVIATDENGAVTFMNPAGEALTVWSAEDARGLELEKVVRIVDEKTGEPISTLGSPDPLDIKWHKQALLYARDGSQSPVEHTSAPLLNKERDRLGSVIVLRNVTERKLADAELREHREKLRELVAERSKEWSTRDPVLTRTLNQHKRTTLALMRTITIAEEAAQAKSDFLANVSQELQTPVRDVLSLTEQLLLSNLTAEQRGHAEEVIRSAESLKAIADDISNFSKINIGKLRPKIAPFNLEEVVNDVARSLRGKAEKKDLVLTASYETEAPRNFVGDANMVGQILTSVVDNAIKFTERGHVKIEVERMSQRLEEAEMRMRVEDTGIGIEKETIEHILEPFDQADTSNVQQYGTIRPGLATAHRLIKMMGGTIEVDSEVGKGTTFTLIFLLRT